MYVDSLGTLWNLMLEMIWKLVSSRIGCGGVCRDIVELEAAVRANRRGKIVVSFFF